MCLGYERLREKFFCLRERWHELTYYSSPGNGLILLQGECNTYGTIATTQIENAYYSHFGKMSLFPAYSVGDSLSKCNEQEIREGCAVETGLFCFKALCGMR